MDGAYMRIRPAEGSDVEGIGRVHRDAIRVLSRLHYTASELDAWIDSFRSDPLAPALERLDAFVSVDRADEIVAFGALDPGKSEIVAIYVHPSVARTGIGKALLERLETAAQARDVERVRLNASLNSADFYFAAGYEFEGATKHRLRSGTQIRCLTMSKALAAGASPVQAMAEMPVFLVPYDDSWPVQFEQESALLRRALGSVVVSIEHIGSTAIPGISAKPIIDVMALVADIDVAPTLFDALETIDYHYFPYAEQQAPERRWFCKPSSAHRTRHLHLTQVGSAHHRNQLAFRDYVRAHRDEAQRYETLKRSLAEQFPNDREAYTDGKSEFVKEILAKAATLRTRTS